MYAITQKGHKKGDIQYDKNGSPRLEKDGSYKRYKTEQVACTAGDPILVGNKIASKVISELNKSKTLPLSRVLFALGIRLVGKSVAELLARRYLTIDALILATDEDMANIEGVGPEIARSVRGFLSVKDNLDVLERLQFMRLSLEENLMR